MLKLLARAPPLILEDADVLEAAVALQILDSLRDQPQKLLNLGIARVPEVSVMVGIFEQQLVRSHRAHAVIDSIPAPRRIALNPVNRRRMNNRTPRPRTAVDGR